MTDETNAGRQPRGMLVLRTVVSLAEISEAN